MKSRSFVSLVLVFGLAFVLTGSAAAQPVPPGNPASQAFSRAGNSPSVINHSVYLPLVRSFDPLLYDDFNNPTFDGAYDPTLWALSGSSGFLRRQQDGVFVFSNDSDLGSGWNCGSLRLKKPQQRTLAQLQRFEARWRFANDLTGGRATIEMNFQTWSFGGHCGAAACVIYADYGAQPMLECSVGCDTGQQYSTGLHEVAYDTWYAVRIEANPVTANLRFYLDNKPIGDYTPSQAADWLAADDFRTYLAACNRDSGTFSTRYLDDVRITPTQ